MKDLFMCLLLNLTNHGKITEANMYASGKWSTVTVETESGVYKFTISKEDEEENAV